MRDAEVDGEGGIIVRKHDEFTPRLDWRAMVFGHPMLWLRSYILGRAAGGKRAEFLPCQVAQNVDGSGLVAGVADNHRSLCTNIWSLSHKLEH